MGRKPALQRRKAPTASAAMQATSRAGYSDLCNEVLHCFDFCCRAMLALNRLSALICSCHVIYPLPCSVDGNLATLLVVVVETARVESNTLFFECNPTKSQEVTKRLTRFVRHRIQNSLIRGTIGGCLLAIYRLRGAMPAKGAVLENVGCSILGFCRCTGDLLSCVGTSWERGVQR